jgi:hypothetical protein
MLQVGLVLILPALGGAAPVVLDDFEDPARSAAWGFSQGAEFPGAAGRFGRAPEAARQGRFGGSLEFDFTGGGAYVAAGLPLPREPALRGITLWLYKATKNRIAFRVTDSAGQTFQKQVEYHFPGWQQVHVRFAPWEAHWGGPNDGLFHGPARHFAVLLENVGGPKTGALWIDEVRGETDGIMAATDRWVTDYPVADFGPDEPWHFEGSGRWEGRQLHYDFTGDGRWAGLWTSISLWGDPQSLTLRFREAGSGAHLRLEIGSHFQTFSRILTPLEGEGERSVTVPLGPNAGWEWGGGENDGLWRPPLRVTALGVEKGEGGAATGAVEFLELHCTTRVDRDAAPVLVAQSLPLPLPAGEGPSPVAFTLTGRHLGPQARRGTLHTTVRDWQGNVLLERETGWELLGQAVPASQTLDVPGGADLPFVEAEFRFTAPGQRPALATATWTRPLEEAGDPTLDPTSPFGMGVYLYRYAHPEQMDRAAALAQAAGCKWSREEFLWHRIEPRRGEFDWSFYDAVVETATRHGICIYGLIDYWSEWAEAYTPAGIADYARYCTALVSRYRDRIKHWEVWNEPNIFFWQGPREMYVDLLKAAYQAIKAADPEAQVLGCSTAGIDTGFIRMVAERGGIYDLLTIHPYRGSLDDRGFIRELQETAALTEALYGDPKPVWITEMGWSTQVQGGVSERQQAGLLARCYLAAVASGACQNISWYDFREDGADPFYNEHHFGVLRHDLTPKPAYRAFATVARRLAGRTSPEPLDAGEGVLAYRFTGPGRSPVVAIWSPETARTLALRVPGEVTAIDLMGTATPLPCQEGIALLPLDAGSPVFLEGLTGRPEILAPPLELAAGAAHPGEAVRVRWRLTNPFPRRLEARLSWAFGDRSSLRSQPVELEPGQAQEGEVLLPVPADAAPGPSQVQATLSLGTLTVRGTVPVEVVPAVLEV